MKVRMKVDKQWLGLEKRSLDRMRADYQRWESKTLQKAKEAKDLRSLREIFYQMGDRWEWNQATGSWLSGSAPLDAVGVVLRMPGLQDHRERYVIYAIMAYSKGVTRQFDHLGDKERVVVERDLRTGHIRCWSTTGHGALDLFATNLAPYTSLEGVLSSCALVAQPGDHALRIELPPGSKTYWAFAQFVWSVATGFRSFETRNIDVLDRIEESFDFRLGRYASAVIHLERTWSALRGSMAARAKKIVVDRIPVETEERNRRVLRETEGLLHILWFKPPVSQLSQVERMYSRLSEEAAPTETMQALLAAVQELASSLRDVIEKAKYIKWRSVMDRESFGKSGAFAGVELSGFAAEAFAAALDDILREHSLSYICYPERANAGRKASRVVLGLLVLPLRLVSEFAKVCKIRTRTLLRRFLARFRKDAGLRKAGGSEDSQS